LLPVLVLVAAVILSGCGGGDDTDTASTGASKGAESSNQVATTQDKGGKDKKAQPKSESSKSKQGPGVSQPKGEPEPGITAKQRSKATTANITLRSSSFASGAAIPVRFGCDGKNESPPLKWSGLPPEAAELVLLVLNSSPIDEALFFDWAVAGLDPGLEGLDADDLPPGAVVGKNSFGKRGYSLCPEAGESENYVFMLYAIPRALDPKPGFDPLVVREAALAESGNAGFMVVPYARH
jgi:phosphatidylethanolamine-binding protein (PEBP) family uncharacterized protein